jgi:uracil-DNA glycosylase
MNPKLITPLLSKLQAVPSSNVVFNPYHAAGPRQNLHAYLLALIAHPYSGHLFVGEAPGHRGGAITGIPFTSERVLRSGNHTLLKSLLPSLTIGGNVTERSATIVWKQFAHRRSLPAFWNAFPFHPHPVGIANENRKPTKAEIESGASFLDAVVQILEPHTIVAVGAVAESVTTTAFPGIRHRTFPHPSYRGTAEFISGCALLAIP